MPTPSRTSDPSGSISDAQNYLAVLVIHTTNNNVRSGRDPERSLTLKLLEGLQRCLLEAQRGLQDREAIHEDP